MSNAVKKPSLSATTKAVRAAGNVVTMTAPMLDYSRDAFKALCDKAIAQSLTAQATFRTICATMATMDYNEYKWARTLAKKVYTAMNPETKEKSVDKAVERAVKKVAPEGWKVPQSKTAKAAADRQRQAEKNAKAPKVQGGQTETKAPAQATPYDKRMTRADVIAEIADTMDNLYDTVAGHMPANVLAAFTAAQNAFKKSIADSWKA